jgi:hypothetical protein
MVTFTFKSANYLTIDIDAWGRQEIVLVVKSDSPTDIMPAACIVLRNFIDLLFAR